jgi:hypothetical protein
MDVHGNVTTVIRDRDELDGVDGQSTVRSIALECTAVANEDAT